MSEDDGKFPCSICSVAFSNPRDLGKHILTDHCDEEDDEDDISHNDVEDNMLTSGNVVGFNITNNGIDDKKSTSGLNNNNNGGNAIIEAHLDPQRSIIMAVDPLEHGDVSEPAMTTSVSLSNLPREPTCDEQKQKFMIHSLSPAPSTSPSSTSSSLTFEHPASRYICLVCGKAYTSRYNIRCHLNMHSGKNVHSCPYCNRFFAHKHVFDSHLRTHTGERPFSCSRCGRAFSDRSNCSSHQKKCRGTEMTVNKVIINNNNNNNHNVSDNSNTQQQQQLILNAQVSSNVDMNEKYSKDNNMEADKNREAARFEPQIISVKSMSELCEKPSDAIFENNLKAFIKDEEDDDDLVSLLTSFSISL
jgi:hypothetical protein